MGPRADPCSTNNHLFSNLLVLGTILDTPLPGITSPIPKGKNNSLADCNNYRGMTLSSALVKLMALTGA